MYEVIVSAENGDIQIRRNHKEVLYWIHTEWEEDPELVFKIASAIQTALTNPVKMDRILREMGKVA